MVGLNSKFSLPVVGKVSLLHAAIGAGVLYVGYNLLTKHKPFGYDSYQGEFAKSGGGSHTGGGGGGHTGGGGHIGGGHTGGGGGHTGGGHTGGGGHSGGGHSGGGHEGGRGGERGEHGGGHDDREFRERLGGLVYDRDYRTRGIWDGVLRAPSPWYNPGTYCPIPVPPGFPCPIGGIGGIIGGYPGVDIDRGIRVGGREHEGGEHREGGEHHGGGGGEHHGGGGGGHSGGGGGGQHGRGFGFMKFSGQAELGYNRGSGDEGGYGDDYGDDYGGFGFKGGHGGGGVGHGGDGRGGVFHGGDHDFDRGRGFHDFDRGFRRFDFDDRLGGGFWPGYEPFIGGYPGYPYYPYYQEPFLGIGGLFGPWGGRRFDWDRGFRGHDFDRGHGGRHFFAYDDGYGDDE